MTPDGETTTQADRLLDTADAGVQLYQQATGADEQTSYPSATTDSEYTPAEVVPDSSGESGVDGLGSIFGSVGDFFRGNPGVALALTVGGAYLLYNAMHNDGPAPKTAGLAGTARGDPKAKRSPPKSRKPIPIIRVH